MAREASDWGGDAREFRTTRWSVVLAAGDSACPDKTQALDRLCRSYWYPLYAYVRHRGHNEHDAQDLTQAFFAHLLNGEGLRRVGPRKTKFRSFLLTALSNFLADEYDQRQAQKRGGKETIISFDAHEAEERYHLEPVHSETPERVFDRRWGAALLDCTLKRLEDEFIAAGKAALLEQLREFIIEGATERTYAQVAGAIGMTEEAVKKAAQRMRHRYQAILREEIADTVTTASEIDEELRHLWSALQA
jgi:RNA polymerase sigma factor (sigma-70 family)